MNISTFENYLVDMLFFSYIQSTNLAIIEALLLSSFHPFIKQKGLKLYLRILWINNV